MRSAGCPDSDPRLYISIPMNRLAMILIALVLYADIAQTAGGVLDFFFQLKSNG